MNKIEQKMQYKFIKSDKRPFKYYVIYNNRKIYFGHEDYEHYKDTTGVGAWSHKDHNDKY